MHWKLRSTLLKVLLYSNRCENSCVNKPDLLRDAALYDESLKYFLNHVPWEMLDSLIAWLGEKRKTEFSWTQANQAMSKSRIFERIQHFLRYYIEEEAGEFKMLERLIGGFLAFGGKFQSVAMQYSSNNSTWSIFIRVLSGEAVVLPYCPH